MLGLDQFRPPHAFGSSHGHSRIIREAYFEDTAYVPLVQRAYELWKDLEKVSGRKMFSQTGGLMIGNPEGVLVSGAIRSAREHHLQHRILSAAEVRKAYPVLHPAEDMIGVFEPRAGILFPEAIIEAHLALAQEKGASVFFDEPVLEWEPQGEAVRVITKRNTFAANKLLITAGAWVKTLLQDLALPLSIERQVMFWFAPRSVPQKFKPENCPVHLWEYSPGRFFYGLPALGHAIKVAIHHEGEITEPDKLRDDVSEGDMESMRKLLASFIPDANGQLKTAMVCKYTNAPDGHFLFDFHPKHKQALIASPCSGHGFKFSSVIGELAATLLNGQIPPFDLRLFNIKRFGSSADK